MFTYFPNLLSQVGRIYYKLSFGSVIKQLYNVINETIVEISYAMSSMTLLPLASGTVFHECAFCFSFLRLSIKHYYITCCYALLIITWFTFFNHVFSFYNIFALLVSFELSYLYRNNVCVMYAFTQCFIRLNY